MSRFLLVLVNCLSLVSFALISDGAKEDSKYTISGNQPGKCIPSHECAAYEATLKTIKASNIEFLRHAQCKVEGDTALVCCPDSGNYTFGDSVLPGNAECGIQAAPNRTLDGIVASIAEFPWMALFVYKRTYADGRPVFGCSGALISDRYVLTAAHCVSGSDFDRLQGIDKIRLGEYNIASDEDCTIENDYLDCSEYVLERSAQEITLHPDYDVDSKQKYNDIALVRLDVSLMFSDFIQPICLPDPATFNFTVQEGETMVVAGWGRTKEDRYSPVKVKLSVSVINNECCGQSYKRFGIDVGHGQICAGGEAAKDACPGHGGGPLMTSNGKTGSWIIFGVVSFGINKCGRSDFPDVYTDVQQYVGWIKATVKP